VALLPADRAESESGDLLEAYRDEQLPARGHVGADAWYLRQVAFVFARSYWFWLAALIMLFVTSDVSNAYQIGARAAVAPPVALTLILAASLQGGWRGRRIRSGLLAGITTCMLLWLFMVGWWMTTWYPLSLVQQAEPYWIDAWHWSAAPGETFTHWIFWDNVGAMMMSAFALTATGLLTGVVGGVMGSTARRLYPRGAA
jgi:hypothetical protein